MDTKQRGVELGKEGHMGERKRGREGGGSEGGREGEGGRCHVYVLLNAHHQRTDRLCWVESVLPQTCGSDPESS